MMSDTFAKILRSELDRIGYQYRSFNFEDSIKNDLEGSYFLCYLKNIPGYLEMSRNEKKRAKARYREMSIIEGCGCYSCSNKIAQPNLAKTAVPVKESTMKESTMTLNIVANAAQSGAQTLEQDAREYLRSRLSKAYYAKVEDLRPAFGLEDDTPPKNPKEVIERITSGMYVLPKENVEYDGDSLEEWYRPWDAIRWRDPAKKKDRDGYDLALKTLAKDRDAVMDIVMTQDSKAGLEALQKFESTTIH